MAISRDAKQDHVNSSHQQYSKMILLFISFIYKPFISQRLQQLTSTIEWQPK